MGKIELEVLIVVENKVNNRNLIAEHGLSFLLKYDGKDYLFDTGQGLAVIPNARALNINLNRLEGVFLSHGHDDHTGGLHKILRVNPGLKVYGHPDIFKPKYSRRDNKFKEIGFNMCRKDIDKFIPVSSLKEITDGLWLTGEIPERIKPSGNYKTGFKPELKDDYFQDDQSIVIETKQGLVVILGCSHAGVINILEYIKNKFDDKLYAVFGGMHLKDKKEERIIDIIDYLSDQDFKLLVPMHCTGIDVVSLMKERLGDKVKRGSTGKRFRI